MARQISFFLALFATAVALGGALAHAFELMNKMGLGKDDYFVVQTIYSGWNRLAYVLLIQLAGIVAVLYLHRHEGRVVRPVAAALGFFILAQAIFWIWTFPANAATRNWTVQPENWEELRLQWEYSHLAGAVCQSAAMAALIVGALRRRAGAGNRAATERADIRDRPAAGS